MTLQLKWFLLDRSITLSTKEGLQSLHGNYDAKQPAYARQFDSDFFPHHPK